MKMALLKNKPPKDYLKEENNYIEFEHFWIKKCSFPIIKDNIS